ncbi:hypothetical protein [Streptomyces sp. SBT349]|uniref:hypothetical protein n=1 Tax=Streptomyces sp. SBT349 TaxID=1580539 RepID=UPI00066B2474|nr:hypothetical protein [Streptomyces sp. SBT349]
MAEEKWEAGFDYPGLDWHQLDVRAEDGAERLAQEIADRGGELDQLYAEAVYPELRHIHEEARKRDARPMVVFVPEFPNEARPLVSITAYVAPWAPPEQGRDLKTVTGIAMEPRPNRMRPPLVSDMELPAGPAVRVHEVLLSEPKEDNRQLISEAMTYYILPPGLPDRVVEMTIEWNSPIIGAEMAETADEMAMTLTLAPAGSGVEAEAVEQRGAV